MDILNVASNGDGWFIHQEMLWGISNNEIMESYIIIYIIISLILEKWPKLRRRCLSWALQKLVVYNKQHKETQNENVCAILEAI